MKVRKSTYDACKELMSSGLSYKSATRQLKLKESEAITIWRVLANKQISRHKEEVLRKALGLPPLPGRKKYWRPCLPVEYSHIEREAIIECLKKLAHQNQENQISQELFIKINNVVWMSKYETISNEFKQRIAELEKAIDHIIPFQE